MTESDIRVGIIGSGMMGAEHMLNLAILPHMHTVAYADPHPESRELGAALAPDADAHDDLAGLLERDDLDAVIVCTPNHTHGDIMAELAGTDLHILLEKPMGHTMEVCDQIVAMAADHPGVIQVGMEYRWMAPMSRLVEEVGAGTIGDLKMITIREHRFPFLDKVDSWNRFNRNSGGTLVEKCCHFFDLMRHITGAEAIRVMASGAQDVNHLDEVYDGEVPDLLDNAYVIVDFDNGARGMLELCMFADDTGQNEHVTAVGDKGRVQALVPASEVKIRRRGLAEETTEHIEVPADVLEAGFHHGSTHGELTAFAAAIRGEAPVMVTVDDGRKAVAVGVAAHLSIDEGRLVHLSEVDGRV